MSRIRTIRLPLATALLATRLLGQTIVPAPDREYRFAGNLNDTFGGPALVAQGGTLTASSYTFGVNQGLLLADPTLDPANYTIELTGSIDLLSGWRKLVDFSNQASDYGLYNLSGSLNFYAFAGSASIDFTASNPVDVMLTRSAATNRVNGYINGVPVLSFTDTGGAARFDTPGQPLYFFVDDAATGHNEAASGSVSLIRLFHEPLDDAQVRQLFAENPVVAVPEPATWLLLGIGLVAWLVRRRSFA